MNTSLSKMLDKQLLESKGVTEDKTRSVKDNKNVVDSLTDQIFHGDKIYLKDGAMAFKPLGMETVLEQVEPTASFYARGKKSSKIQMP